ncbi:MAG: PD-(D/E)XK nuclease family protein [Desulfurococcales archaeon]|nr:PD-(D/E)XK nuclease family protein [Desulfurococcales archaeon]
MYGEERRILSAIEKALLTEAGREYLASPSQVWVTEVSQCLRQAFYNRVMVRERNVGAAYSILRGKLLHEAVLKNIPLGESEKVLETRSIRLGEGDTELRGRADLVAGSYVVDLKTSERAPSEPPREYVNQIQLYMLLYGKPRGMIVYITKAGLRHFTIERDDSLIEELKKKAVKLSKALRENRLPEPETGPWCRWCPWASQQYCPEGASHIGAEGKS